MNAGSDRGQFYGKEAFIPELMNFHLRECEIAGFHLTETLLPPNYKIPKHSHNNASFCFVLAGSFLETYGSRSSEHRSFSMIFSPKDGIHSDRFGKTGGRCFYMEFSPLSLERAREYSLQLDKPVEFQGGALSLISMRLYREFCEMDNISPLVIEGLAFEIMAGVSRRHDHRFEQELPQWFHRIKDLLHARFTENLTLTEIAALGDVHPAHLTRVFRRFCGCSIGEYVRRLRIENGSLQLTSTKKSLAEIALTLGFSDQAHFSRIFKNQMGLTPAQFRNVFSSR